MKAYARLHIIYYLGQVCGYMLLLLYRPVCPGWDGAVEGSVGGRHVLLHLTQLPVVVVQVLAVVLHVDVELPAADLFFCVNMVRRLTISYWPLCLQVSLSVDLMSICLSIDITPFENGPLMFITKVHMYYMIFHVKLLSKSTFSLSIVLAGAPRPHCGRKGA